jgi:hypothetical protein
MLFCAIYLLDKSVILLSLQKCALIPVRVEEFAIEAASLTRLKIITECAKRCNKKEFLRVQKSQAVCNNGKIINP